MINSRRGDFTRGTSVLAALVFVAVLSTIAYAVHAIVPNDPLAQTASATLAADTTFEPNEAKGEPLQVTPLLANLSGDERCKAPIENKEKSEIGGAEEPSSKDESVQTACVRGCRYDISIAKGVTKVLAKDLAVKSNGEIDQQYVAINKCAVRQCDESGKCIALDTASMSDQTLSSLLAAKSRVNAALVQIKESPDLQKALQQMQSGSFDSYNKLSSGDQDLIKSAQQEQIRQNDAQIKSNLEIIRSMANDPPEARSKVEAENARLVTETENLKRVSSILGKSQSSISAVVGCGLSGQVDGECPAASPDGIPYTPKVVGENTFGASMVCGQPGANPDSCIPANAKETGSTNPKEAAKNLPKVEGNWTGAEPPPGVGTNPSCSGGVCKALPRNDAEYRSLLLQGYRCEADAGGNVCWREQPNRGGNKPDANPGPQVPPPGREAPPPGKRDTTETTTKTTQTQTTPRSTSSWLSDDAMKLGVQGFLTGFMGSMAASNQQQSRNGAPPGYQPPIGNSIPQQPGTCGVSLYCQNGMQYQRNAQCVDQVVQTCQYGCNGNQCVSAPQNQCPPPPQMPPASACSGTWNETTSTLGNAVQCVTGWTCELNTPGATTTPDTTPTGAPTAEISCAPSIADAGTAISITYACGNSATSSGSNFSTRGALSGTASLTAPTASTTISFGVACVNTQGQAKTDTCSVQIVRPTIVLVARPQSVAPGEKSTVGWVSTGMQSCVISSPQSSAFTAANAGQTATSGTAETPPLTASMTMVLRCETLGGNVRSASTTVVVR